MTELERFRQAYNHYSNDDKDRRLDGVQLQLVTNEYGEFSEELWYDIIRNELIFVVYNSEDTYVVHENLSLEDISEILEDETADDCNGIYDNWVGVLDGIVDDVICDPEYADSHRCNFELDKDKHTFVYRVTVTGTSTISVYEENESVANEIAVNKPTEEIQFDDYFTDYVYELEEVI